MLDAARSVGVDVAQPKLKWPNDVLVGNAKLCGILIETGQLHGRLWMAAGFGVNVEVAPERPDRPTTCLADMPGGQGLTAARLLTALDMAFRVRLRSLLVDGFEPTRADWLANAAHLGSRVDRRPPAAGSRA